MRFRLLPALKMKERFSVTKRSKFRKIQTTITQCVLDIEEFLEFYLSEYTDITNTQTQSI